jgi:Cu/Ag efflux pump CusA
VPVTASQTLHPLLGDVARIENGTVVGEYDRINGQRMVTLSANVAGEDLGRVATGVDAAIARAGEPPRGAAVSVRGQIAPMRETLRNIAVGLQVAIVVIFLLLAANFQSLRLALGLRPLAKLNRLHVYRRCHWRPREVIEPRPQHSARRRADGPFAIKRAAATDQRLF